MENILEQVKDFAGKAHGEQRRKFADEPYIAHPIRVMEICATYTKDVCILAAALLHDVLEDTPVTKEQIKDFLLTIMEKHKTDRTLHLVDELTDQYVKANYPMWNRRKRKAMETERLANTSTDAQSIKYADIIDNSAEIVHQTDDFAGVFLRECRALLQKMDKGNAQLYQRALDTVNAGLEQMK
jgi:guanosine-3',5'-bis(diphosphate) 3'-pyrophosphohydrolase